jgi:hypothetical protein
MEASELIRRRPSGTVVVIAGVFATVALTSAPASGADTAQSIPSCDAPALHTAVDAGGTWILDSCAGQTISQTDGEPLTVDGTNVTFVYNGGAPAPVVTFTGTDTALGGATFQVRSGSLTLKNFIVEGSLRAYNADQAARGGAIYVGADGTLTLDEMSIQDSTARGIIAADGLNGTSGSPDGAAGQDAHSPAQGGGVYNAGTSLITNTTFQRDYAFGGEGGGGGNGLNGAAGASGALFSGDDGQPGENGGNGGDGGVGAPAAGGAIYNTGDLTVRGAAFFYNQAWGGNGGHGGSDGRGGYGGDGGWGPSGAEGGPGLRGGDGSPGGSGGRGGDAGTVTGSPQPGQPGSGGGVYNAGTTVIDASNFYQNLAHGGDGGGGGGGANPGHGGEGGIGGSGGKGGDNTAGQGGAGGFGAPGGNTGQPGGGGAAGTDGADAGAGRGGAVYDADGEASVVNSTFSNDLAGGGLGGYGGDAAGPDSTYTRWSGGQGGSGGAGGYGTTFGGRGGNAGNGGNGVFGTAGWPAGDGGDGGDATAAALYTVGGTHLGCSDLHGDAQGLVPGLTLLGGSRGRGEPGSLGGRPGSPGYGGGGARGGKRGMRGQHGQNGDKLGGYHPPGKSGAKGAADHPMINGAIVKLGCASTSPAAVAMYGLVGKASQTTVAVHNSGDVPLQMGGASIDGAPSGTLTASGCTTPVPVGGKCIVTVVFRAKNTSTVDATLTVADNSLTGEETVPITATGTTPATQHATTLYSGAPVTTIDEGASFTAAATLVDADTNFALAGQLVTLADKPAGASTFTPIRSVTTDASGQVAALVKPTSNTTYRWEYAGDNGLYRAVTSANQAVQVAVVVSAHATKTTVRHRKKLKIWGTLNPPESGARVVLERAKSGKWIPAHASAIIRSQPLPNGQTGIGYVIRTRATRHKGTVYYRVHRDATSRNAAGDSAPLTIAVD